MSMQTLQIGCNQQVYRTFTLPYSGTVLVRIGQEVAAGDPIAEVRMPARYQVFDVVNNFKINPRHIDRYIERLVGEPVKAGDIIAQKSGIIGRIFRASEDGMVVAIRDGKITLALGEKVVQVLVAFPGTVVEIISEQGAVIATQGALLQGIWGNGLNVSAVLTRWGEEVEAEKADGFAGKILAVDHCASRAQLNRYLAEQPAGMVFGSVLPQVLPELERADIPMMVLVGFGELPLDPISLQMLKQMQGQMVVLNANPPDPLEGTHPELILPGRAQFTEELFPAEELLKVGRRVRLLGKPYAGSVGTVIELPEQPEMFASGLVMEAVVVQREDEQVIRVPRANIVVIIE
ncbi:MAG TPA: hypothetical protein PLX92_07690 [Anaerolineaceae bacterium]|nr:hypothetical protein [Anaerolineaceae bacterium]